MAAYYLHSGFQHEDELAYRDDLLGAVISVVDRMSEVMRKQQPPLMRMQVGGDVRVAEDTPMTQTHHSDSEVDLDDDIQLDPYGQHHPHGDYYASRYQYGHDGSYMQILIVSSLEPTIIRQGTRHYLEYQRMYEDLYQNYMLYADYLRFLESTYNVRLFGDGSYASYYDGFVDIYAQHDEEDY
ncbi:hypothetical protein Taro_035442, partial [Colocasia esculenta]|nr:hypothetical protein [Colocasia esculenta]